MIKNVITVTSHALESLPCQTVTPSRTPSPLERDVLYGRHPMKSTQRTSPIHTLVHCYLLRRYLKGTRGMSPLCISVGVCVCVCVCVDVCVGGCVGVCVSARVCDIR